MINLLITILIGALIIYLIKWVIDILTLPPQVKMIAYVILGIAVLLWLLRLLGIYV